MQMMQINVNQVELIKVLINGSDQCWADSKEFPELQLDFLKTINLSRNYFLATWEMTKIFHLWSNMHSTIQKVTKMPLVTTRINRDTNFPVFWKDVGEQK